MKFAWFSDVHHVNSACRCLILCLHVTRQLASCVSTRQHHIGCVAHTYATILMAHLGAGMPTWLLQPLTIFGAFRSLVCQIIRMALPAAASQASGVEPQLHSSKHVGGR